MQFKYSCPVSFIQSSYWLLWSLFDIKVPFEKKLLTEGAQNSFTSAVVKRRGRSLKGWFTERLAQKANSSNQKILGTQVSMAVWHALHHLNVQFKVTYISLYF